MGDSGLVDVDTATPTEGVYSKPDPLALLRNGLTARDPDLKNANCQGLTEPTKASDEVFVGLELNDQIVASTRFRLISSNPELKFVTIAEENLHGVFCRPNQSDGRPVVISLHGSEGGSLDKARHRAALFAARGYPCLAINFFARAYEGIDGLRTEHENVTLEIIESARAWLAKQESMNSERICLYGSSKGAEFALLVPAARIEVESIKGKVLLLAADRDEVWASGDMTRNMVERFAAAGKNDKVRAVVYPTAGHMITGTPPDISFRWTVAYDVLIETLNSNHPRASRACNSDASPTRSVPARLLRSSAREGIQ